jgi:hypothetical protein
MLPILGNIHPVYGHLWGFYSAEQGILRSSHAIHAGRIDLKHEKEEILKKKKKKD